MSLFSLRKLVTGTGWRPDTEYSGLSWSEELAINDHGRHRGVPVFGSPNGMDTTALGPEVWKLVAATPDVGAGSPARAGVDATWGPLASASSSTSGTGGSADPTAYDFSSGLFSCRSLSACEPCPPQTRNHPFCRPYGNRRLVSCKANSSRRDSLESQKQNVTSRAGVGEEQGISAVAAAMERAVKPPPPADLEFQGWEACGKVISSETRDYFEFVLILILLGLGSLVMLVRRNRELLKLQQSGQTGTGRSTSGAARRRRARLG
ncbi:hypothetical protein BCV69DRAFT_279722 [Microstroma glucosiphilum]|uniref:Uncharacterized protein n=1 Tax=Pseudomicrostroma glucosiphilum TaxID=1684307 RepID=A0A316UFU1_9BASI|nr:hypothetical protein BCV69DRAFT_279722 [Pseudomicrostroma glucosiphilum]PWN23808.1 hypothetical protein BCV69DRAFT_279722 [Pseudomicrostroma glucosiphilum]